MPDSAGHYHRLAPVPLFMLALPALFFLSGLLKSPDAGRAIYCGSLLVAQIASIVAIRKCSQKLWSHIWLISSWTLLFYLVSYTVFLASSIFDVIYRTLYVVLACGVLWSLSGGYVILHDATLTIKHGWRRVVIAYGDLQTVTLKKYPKVLGFTSGTVLIIKLKAQARPLGWPISGFRSHTVGLVLDKAHVDHLYLELSSRIPPYAEPH